MRDRFQTLRFFHCLFLLFVFLTGCISPLPKPGPKLEIETTSLPDGVVGTAYSASVSAMGGKAPYTYVASGLPSSLSIATASGTIAGTPAQNAIGAAEVTLTVTDSSSPQQTATAKMSVTIDPAKLVLVTSSLPNGVVGSAYSSLVAASGGVTPYKFSASGLPAGLSMNASTGAIKGTPAQSSVGTANVAVTVMDSAASPQSASAKINIVVVASGLVISTDTLPAGTVGKAYTASLAVNGGTTPYAFSASGLPSGLAINAATGAISGTPAQNTAGTAQVKFTVTDASTPKQSASVTLGLTINTTQLSILTSSLPSGTVGSAYSGTVAASGGATPYKFSASGLPSGLSINASTGAVTGKPAQGTAGTKSVTFTVTDSSTTPQSASKKLNIVVAASALMISTSSLPSGTVGDAYTASVAASGGSIPYAFSASGLPSGLSINSSTGAISGTPAQSAVGTAQVKFTVTDASSPKQTESVTLGLTINTATGASACGQMSTGDNANLNGYVPFPATNAWNTDISNAPLDPNNTTITTASGFAGEHLHHDWSSVAGGNYGIPYTVVDSSVTPLVPIDVIDYASESDVAMAPYPITAPIEGAPADCDGWPDTYVGDSHVLVLDRHACMLYETFNTHRCKGQWSSSSETIWDLTSYDERPWGWTSADAAGLPIFPGLVRYDEVASGAINHAIRFTLPHTKNDANGGYFVEPASHAAGTDYGVDNVMGMRIRLKANFDISSYSQTNQVILTAMKKYGMILADNGSYFYFQGVPDSRWDDDDLVNLDSIQSSNFEVVQMTPTYPGYDDATAPTGNPPTIDSFTASADMVPAGTPVTLTWTTTNDSYDFIDKLGGIHGGTVTITPTATTTYTLNATNQFGRSTAVVTVTVQ
ncbi:MAG TPA: Ig domain-containing protein [Terracidiphilus sp.]|nr:Ig domain-containing protein [Terracidiphilus sp.]